MLSFFKNHPFTTFFTLTACIAVCVNHSIFLDYGFSDAYEFVWSGANKANFTDVFYQNGRFVTGWINVFLYKEVIQNISDLKFLRGVSLLLCVFLNYHLFWFMIKRLNWKTFNALLVTISFLFMPSYTVYMGWSATWLVPLAIELSFFSGILLFDVLIKNKDAKFRIPISFVLLIISLAIYQPTLTAVLIPFVFYYTTNRILTVKPIIVLTLLVGTAVMCYFLLFKYMLFIYQLEPLDRTTMDFISLPSKMIEFFSKELDPAYRSSWLLLLPRTGYRFGLIVFICFFIILISKVVKGKLSWLNLMFLVMVLPFSFFVNLLSSEGWTSSRTIAVPGIIVLFYQMYFVITLVDNKKYERYILGGLVVFLGIGAFYNQNYALAGLQAKEYQIVTNKIKKIISENKGETIIIQYPEYYFAKDLGLVKNTYSDEFGVFSMGVEWAIVPFFNQIVKEELGQTIYVKGINSDIPSNTFPLKIYPSSEIDSVFTSKNASIIDVEDLLREALKKN